GARAPAPRLCTRDGRAMDARGRSRDGASPRGAARTRERGQDCRLAVARRRSAHRLCGRRSGGCVMDAPVPRRSRFAGEAGRGRIRVSFEFFPPKTAEMEQTLWEAIGRLAPLAPAFVSVTYGAGGSTRERTHATVKRILAETSLVPAAHLTCVAATRAEID